MKVCKNCSENFEGNFCNNCGQKYINHRFQLKDSIVWVFHSFFNFDNGFLFTSKEVVLRPQRVILGFINGITVRYSHPFRFIFIWATISALVGVYVGSFEDTSIGVNKAMGMTEEDLKNGQKVRDFMKQYMSFVILLMVPFYSIGSYWLFKKKGFNFAEHLIINSYAQSSSILVGLPIMFIYYFFPVASTVGTTSFILGLLVLSRAYALVFEVKWIVAFLKYLINMLIAVILFSITIGLLAIVFALLAKGLGFENPFKPA